jgi:hypothetical protein
MFRNPLVYLFLLAACAFAGAQEIPNLVKNPGFEQVQAGKPTGWTLTGPAALDNAQFYAGAMGLVLRNAAPATATATQAVRCGEKEYVALAWVRTEKVAGVGARVRLLGQSGQIIAESKPVTGEAAWQQLVVPFNPGNNGNVTVELSLAQASGAAWFDDIVVAEAAAAKALLQAGEQGPQRENLALHKPYELSPPPSYEHSTDADDVIQLTDGEYTAGYFWTQKSTVGWYLYSPQITIDLGSVQPISGIMINCPGGGAAGVQFPTELTYLVSDDNEHFYQVARLTPKGLKQDGKSWYTHKFLADNLNTRGRYVMIRTVAGGSTFFADEVEVYKGEHNPATVTFAGKPRNRLEMAYGQYSLSPTTYTRGHFPETPHVKWGMPLAGGPIKSIVMCYSDDMRDVCELAQRLDLDYVPVSHFSYYRPEPLGSLMQEQIETALPTARVMVVGGYRWEATPKPLLEKIKARVRECMGLVVVSSNAPFNKGIDEVFKETPLTGDQGLTDLVPMSLIPGYHKPSKSHFTLARYGEGRVALVDPGWYTKYAHSLAPTWNLEALDDDANTPQEYQWVALSKVILWAAVHDDRKLEQLTATPERISIKVSPLLRPAKLEIVTRDSFFDPIKTETREVPAAGLSLDLATVAGTNGVHPVDVWVRDAEGKIIDFGSTSYVTDNGARLDSLALDKPVYAPREPVDVTLKLSGDLQGLRVQTQLVDLYGRQLAPSVGAAVTGNEMSLQVPVSEPVTLEANLFVSLLQGNRVIERRLERVWLDRPEVDDYTFMAWYSWEHQPTSYYGGALLRQYGLDGYVSLPGTTRAQNAAYNNLRHGPENVSRVAPENKDDSRVRVPCLSDPEFRAKTAERIEKMAQEVRPYGVTEWSLGDESTLGQRDYCTSPSCLAAFRKYLQAQYRTLDALNASWGSSFAAWDQVVPATLAEVDKKPCLAAWLDHRRYMESLFAEYHDWCKALITKHVPAARVGISGTPNVNSYSGHDWWKLMQGPLTHLSSYGGVQREMQRSFALPGTFVSSFLGYDYTDDDEQRARYGPWDLVFHGSNGVNYYTLVSNTLNCPLIRPDMSLTNKAPWYFDEVAQLKQGFGRLFMSAKYANDGIAVHYSPASVHAATATGLFDNRDRLRRYDNNLSNLGMILSQLHLQYNFIHEEQMAKGELSKYKVLILPWSSAISEREAKAIREFVKDGGTVIADSYCGVRDDHGAPRAMLDDLFGIKQTLTPPQLQPGEMVSAAGATRIVPVASGSLELQLAGGKALRTVGTAPAYVINNVGKGKAIFLNCSFSNYADVSAGGVAGETLDQEVAPETVTAPIRQFVQSLLADALVQAPVVVSCRANEDAAVETSRLRLDQTELLGVVRGITAGAVNPTDLLDCKLTLPQKRFVYDSRSGKYLGEVTEIEDRLPRGIARVYALLKYRVAAVGVSAPARVQAGSPLELKLAVKATDAAATVGTHVLHVTITGPDGKPRSWYDRNVVATGGKAALAIPVAFNDTPGAWTVAVRDIATGVTGKATVNVMAPTSGARGSAK